MEVGKASSGTYLLPYFLTSFFSVTENIFSSCYLFPARWRSGFRDSRLRKPACVHPSCLTPAMLNPFTTGNPFLGTKLLGFSTGRGLGALKSSTPALVLRAQETGVTKSGAPSGWGERTSRKGVLNKSWGSYRRMTLQHIQHNRYPLLDISSSAHTFSTTTV